MKASCVRKVLFLSLCTALLLATLSGCKKEPVNDVNPNINPTEAVIGSNSVESGNANQGVTTPGDSPDAEDPFKEEPTAPAEPVPDPAQSGDDATTPSDGETSTEGEQSDTPTEPTTDPSEGEASTTLPTTGGDPWALTPAPTVESLLKDAVPYDKTIHATMMVSMTGELVMDLSALEADGWEVESGSDEIPDTKFSIYMNSTVTQDADTCYMDGTTTSYVFGENESEVSRAYSTKNINGTMDTYTYVPDTGKWVSGNTAMPDTFGISFISDLSKMRAEIAEGLTLEDTGTEYVLTGDADSDVFNMISGSTVDISDGATAPKATIAIRFDHDTRELRSIVISCEPTSVAFFSMTSMNMAIANITFDTEDVSVPTTIQNSATPENAGY